MEGKAASFYWDTVLRFTLQLSIGLQVLPFKNIIMLHCKTVHMKLQIWYQQLGRMVMK